MTILDDEKQEGEEEFNNVFTDVPSDVSTGTPGTSRVVIEDDERKKLNQNSNLHLINNQSTYLYRTDCEF